MLRNFKFIKQSAKNFAEANKIPLMKGQGIRLEKKEEVAPVKKAATYKPLASHKELLKFCADYAKLYTALHSQIYTDTIKRLIEEKIKSIENSLNGYRSDERVGSERVSISQEVPTVKTIKEAEQLLIKTIKHDEKFKLQV
mgnify:CR=1 FL=1